MRRLGRLAVAEWLAGPTGRGPPWGLAPAVRFLSDGALPGAAQSSTVDVPSAPADRPKEEHVYVPRNLKRFGRLLFKDGADRNRLRARRPPSAAPAAPAIEETPAEGPGAPHGDESKRPPAESQAAAEVSGEPRLFVSGLNPNTTWQALKDHMRSAGKVVYTSVRAVDGRGEGIVQYRSVQEAALALETLDNTPVEGQFIRLQWDNIPRAGYPKTKSSTTTTVDPSDAKGRPAAVARPADESGLGDRTDAPAPTPRKAPSRRQRPPRPPKGPATSSDSPATPPSESASDTAAAAPAGKAVATTGERVSPTDDPPASSSTHVAGSPGSSAPPEEAGPGPSVQALIFTMLHAAKTHIENYELVEADKQLELAAAAGATQNPAYLHLLSILRLKQRRIAEAAAARDTLLQQHPDMLDNPVILSNAAWLYVHQREPGKAIDLLERAEAFGSDAPKDTVYIRALLHSGQNQLDRAEEVLRRAVLPDGKLIPLQDTTDVKLGMLLTEVLVLLDRAKEAEPLVAPIVAASAAINGPGHVVTLCAMEGQAAVARALGRHAEAVDLLRPVVADLGRRLGPHDLTLSAVGLLAKAYLDLFLALRVQCGPVKEAPLSKAALDALEALRSHVQQWLTMAEQVDPQSHDFAQAKHHHEVVQVVCRLEGLGEADGAPPPPSSPPATAAPQS